MADPIVRIEIGDQVLEQRPEFFERLVISLLSAMGYSSEGTPAKAVGRVGDGGIDGLIHQDKLGLDVVYVQAKRYQASAAVGRPERQAFVGALAGIGAQKGFFVTTSKSSAQACAFIKTIHQRVILIDGGHPTRFARLSPPYINALPRIYSTVHPMRAPLDAQAPPELCGLLKKPAQCWHPEQGQD